MIDAGAGGARLSARPQPPSEVGALGRHRLGLAPGRRDGWLYAPAAYRADEPAPLLVTLHGAGADAGQGLDIVAAAADVRGFLVLSIDSRGRSWDVLSGFGPDVTYLDRALQRTFARHDVDRVAIGGFSDGASYALTLGLANGDLFETVLAYSPGFAAPPERHGSPRVFVSHGTRDSVLPVDTCGRRVVAQLERSGCAVRYAEFDGRHEVPSGIVTASIDFWLGPTAAGEE